MSDPTSSDPVKIHFHPGEHQPVVSLAELDAALDEFDARARDEGEPWLVTLSADGGDNRLTVGVGADLVPVAHDDDRPGREGPAYVISHGSLSADESIEWSISNTVSELPQDTLIPAVEAREAVRRWFTARQRPDNIRWQA